jgi:hypothetical protein
MMAAWLALGGSALQSSPPSSSIKRAEGKQPFIPSEELPGAGAWNPSNSTRRQM